MDTQLIGQRVSGLVAVTIKQLEEASRKSGNGGVWISSSCRLDTIKLCGNVEIKEECKDFTIYTLMDGTGLVYGAIWPNVNTGVTDLFGCKHGDYYDVTATVHQEEDYVALKTVKARKIVNFNDVTHHFLSVIYNYLDNSRTKSLTSCESTEIDDDCARIDVESILAELSTDHVERSDRGVSQDYLVKKLGVDPRQIGCILRNLQGSSKIYETSVQGHYKLSQMRAKIYETSVQGHKC